MECAPPPSDHDAKAYRVPVPPACVPAGASSECELPGIHWNVCGVVTAAPSTSTCSPPGDEAMVTGVSLMKFPVTLFGPLTTKVCGFALPLRSPLKLSKTYPEAGVAITCSELPAENQLPLPATVPPAAGLAA